MSAHASYGTRMDMASTDLFVVSSSQASVLTILNDESRSFDEQLARVIEVIARRAPSGGHDPEGSSIAITRPAKPGDGPAAGLLAVFGRAWRKQRGRAPAVRRCCPADCASCLGLSAIDEEDRQASRPCDRTGAGTHHQWNCTPPCAVDCATKLAHHREGHREGPTSTKEGMPCPSFCSLADALMYPTAPLPPSPPRFVHGGV